MTLIKTSLLNAIAMAIKMLTMLGINKIMAIYVGPAGYAALGQFQNAIQIITTFGSGAINTGVTKYTAENYEDEIFQKKVWRTAGSIALIASTLIGGLISIFSDFFSVLFFNSVEYRWLFVFLGLSLVFLVFNALFLSILNGKKEIKKYIAINILGSFSSLIISVVMIFFLGLKGAFLSIIINQSIVCFFSFFVCLGTKWFEIKNLVGKIDSTIAKNLGKYTVMALTTALAVPVSHILVRNLLGENLGWDVAGYWEAMVRLSGVYLMFVTATLSVYYIPRFSELHNSKDIKKEVIEGYKIILPIVIGMGVCIYFLRDFIIEVLFTDNFFPMRELFLFQIIGDVVKISSWIIGYLLAIKTFVKAFVLSEIFFSFFYVFLVWFFIDFFGMTSSVIAYFINYVIHYVFIFSYLRFKRVM